MASEKRVLIDNQFDTMMTSEGPTTGSSRRHNRLAKRENGHQMYNLNSVEDGKKKISDSFARSDDSPSFDPIDSPHSFFADGEDSGDSCLNNPKKKKAKLQMSASPQAEHAFSALKHKTYHGCDTP